MGLKRKVAWTISRHCDAFGLTYRCYNSGVIAVWLHACPTSQRKQGKTVAVEAIVPNSASGRCVRRRRGRREECIPAFWSNESRSSQKALRPVAYETTLKSDWTRVQRFQRTFRNARAYSRKQTSISKWIIVSE